MNDSLKCLFSHGRLVLNILFPLVEPEMLVLFLYINQSQHLLLEEKIIFLGTTITILIKSSLKMLTLNLAQVENLKH